MRDRRPGTEQLPTCPRQRVPETFHPPSPAAVVALLLILAVPALFAQSKPPVQAVPEEPTHDISMVETAPLGGAIAVPLPERYRKRLQRYEIPELVGSRQALGPQLIDGRLPHPILDYSTSQGDVHQRLSIFEGGLVVVDIRSAGVGGIHKKVLIPDDALHNYMKAISTASLQRIALADLSAPRDGRHAFLRVYDSEGSFVERAYDPMGTLPKQLADQVVPLEDLLRALYEDRAVTNTVAGYKPKAGDELVGDDRRIYRVERVVDDRLVELRCLSQPMRLYVAAKDLYLYFIGTPGAASR